MALYLQLQGGRSITITWRETRRGKGAKTATRSEHSAEGTVRSRANDHLQRFVLRGQRRWGMAFKS